VLERLLEGGEVMLLVVTHDRRLAERFARRLRLTGGRLKEAPSGS
jgi:predicted ABC-type transport system involved in lysophospholipase L1 biosynthesis ATPase subunit